MRIFVLGLDGAVKHLIDRPELPNLQKVIREGCLCDLISRPPITSVAWTSMVSGVNAGKHGIFGFRIGDKLNFSTEKKAKELWDYLPSIAINIPMTFPVRPIDGIMISGMMTPELYENSVYPASEMEYLKQIGFIFEPEIDLKSCGQSIDIKIELIKHYLDYNWELFFVVFREFDVIQHFFWGQDLPYYQKIDHFLDWLINEKNLFHDEQTSLLIVSDHGFAPVDKTFDLQEWINQNGYAKQVMVGGWGALYIKPETENEKQKIKKGLEENLKQIKYDGKPILDVYPREKIYWGPYAEKGPDIVVSPKRTLGFTFGMRTGKIIGASIHKNGCHLEEGVFAAWGPQIKELRDINREARVYDVMPTVLELAGKEVPKEVDGVNLLSY
ncbi:hypothetical protein B5M47_03935 [candidate division CPR3 bacterium 4484_211]|uniref:Phosphodiesterase n=1 Tax=candidate division CPR3 bacterium 4484_211 TaxID=1968527 RepID=A0A1W9NVY2_UNCC3|nr:MAG: hypothetical protein B5M47_03935 [candidate division CPR3 bacterium 4484_211]